MDARKIFISYRRADARADAGRLYDRLDARYPGRVFRDVGSLEPGVEWHEAIDTVLASTDAFIVVIGPGWLNAADASGKRRIDDARDEARKEVSIALKNRIRVFPVLVGDARMPSEDELPDDVRALARRNALELTEQDFDEGVDKLVRAIERTPGWGSSGATRSSAARLVSAVAVFVVLVVIAAPYMLRRLSDNPSTAGTTPANEPSVPSSTPSSAVAPVRVEPSRAASPSSPASRGAAPAAGGTNGVTPSIGQITMTWNGEKPASWQVLDSSQKKVLRYASVAAGQSETLDIAPGDYFVTLDGRPEIPHVAVTVGGGRASVVTPLVGQITFTWNGEKPASWQVLDSSQKKILRYASVGVGQSETLDIAPGDYFIALDGKPEIQHVAVTVAGGRASVVTPSVGQITFTWNGEKPASWQVLDPSQKKIVRYASAGAGQSETLDIAPGDYFIALDGKPEIQNAAVTVTARRASSVTPSVGQITFTWSGVKPASWQVLDASKRKVLRYAFTGAGQTETLDIAPGNYFVALDGHPEIQPAAVTVSAKQPALVSLPR